MEYKGITHKFTIRPSDPVECYLQTGIVSEENQEKFSHLKTGDICFIGLTLSKQGDELRIYEVLCQMANMHIAKGGHFRDIYPLWRDQNILPNGQTMTEGIAFCKSIIDYVARYLVGYA